MKSTTAMHDGIYCLMAEVESSKGESLLKPQKYYRCILIITCLTALLLVMFSLQTLLLPSILSSGLKKNPPITHTCTDACRLVLVESIPVGVEFNSSVGHPSIYQSWLSLLSEAQSSLDIASFYWSLTNEDTHTHEPTANQGEKILQELVELSGKISVRIAVNTFRDNQPQHDIQQLVNAGADVRDVDMQHLTSGVLHTKFWVVDKKHIYIGSANMDWRSLTQVKELSAVVYDCKCLAEDLGKIFEAYWFLGDSKTIPAPWPSQYSTAFNKDKPMQLPINGTDSRVYLSSSPPSLCAEGRTPDLQAILSIINDAQQFVYIAVMNYLPTMEYSASKRYWGDIDTELRRVAFERMISVRLLISCWNSTSAVMFPFLHSLASLQDSKSNLDIQVKIFVVPSSPSQKKIPFARVNHNKYMVTDRVAYLGTSNWSGDYFVNTAGSALVVNQTSTSSSESPVRKQLQAVFERDWDSSYSTPLKYNSNLEQICEV
ncbi:5'-3' exonuclease PLD3 isoform X2 [Neoarius graeffei]|uniref:5'-3' exonuclease PLD3 isoform X2 n=1 Tax=Neoarius graeffei TaxID=443677 RepID=UPI00298D1A1A|nr:5'-3' exonuclease PLD3 isoform X2 [Neoarius graeffei]XP_060779550.1 5'-3' exonuclease PLD3 isoform X2 [Neoarius graeffei]